MIGAALLTRLRGLARDRRALGAVEFAMAAPFMILLYIGGAQLMDAISAYRKVVLSDRTLADVTTQYVTITQAEVDTIIDGARQVMSPYPTDDTTMIVTQIKFDDKGNPSIDWSRSNDGTVMKASDLNVPTNIAVPDTYIVLSQITYHYKPRVAATLIGPITFTDHIYMNPRRSNSVACSDCT